MKDRFGPGKKISSTTKTKEQPGTSSPGADQGVEKQSEERNARGKGDSG